MKIILATLFLASSAFANHHKEVEHTGPCAPIAAACKAAGFVGGGHKKDGKGLFADCLKPIVVDNKPVAGVDMSKVDDASKAACKAKWEEHKAEHSKKHHKEH